MRPEFEAHLREMEGCRLESYLDSAGYPTIGVGHRIKSLTNTPITEHQASVLLEADVDKARREAFAVCPSLKDASERRQDAITDFCFNLGPARLAESTLRSYVEKGDWGEAAKQMTRWVYAKNAATGKAEVLPGLVKRRARMAEWLREG